MLQRHTTYQATYQGHKQFKPPYTNVFNNGRAIRLLWLLIIPRVFVFSRLGALLFEHNLKARTHGFSFCLNSLFAFVLTEAMSF
jgi:hypothetical protein